MLHPLRVVSAIGAITRLFSVAFLLPVLIAVLYDQYDVPVGGVLVPRGVLVFFFGFALTFLVGTGLRRLGRAVVDEDLAEREAYLTVGLGWLFLVILATLPFMMMGILTSPVDAFFEAMSGLTATGATVMDTHFDDTQPSLMMWRAFLQFLGGMGIIVLSIAVLARLTHGGVQMLQAEVPGPTFGRVAPRLADTARRMWRVYLLLAAILFVLLLVILTVRHDMPGKQVFYEALLHTFTTIATGGFSNHAASIAYFDDPVLEAVLIVFMLTSGMNYVLILLVGHGQWRSLWADHEWRFYMANFWLAMLVITGILWRAGAQIIPSLRDAAFVVASMMTSSGFVTADYDAWPPEAKFIVLFLMVAGGSAGSTSGGMKMARVLLLFKVAKGQMMRVKHPHVIAQIRMAGHALKPATIMAAVGFFMTFVAIWVIGTILLVALDPAFSDVVHAASASLAALSNIGPGLGVVGPMAHYGHLEASSKLILSAQMWFGRLEIFTALLVFMPSTWRH